MPVFQREPTIKSDGSEVRSNKYKQEPEEEENKSGVVLSFFNTRNNSSSSPKPQRSRSGTSRGRSGILNTARETREK